MMPQQQRGRPQPALQQIVYNTMMRNAAATAGGWQAGVNMTDRLGRCMNLITNIHLAGGMEIPKAAELGMALERDAFTTSADKV
jgi:hypothetical protein